MESEKAEQSVKTSHGLLAQIRRSKAANDCPDSDTGAALPIGASADDQILVCKKRFTTIGRTDANHNVSSSWRKPNLKRIPACH
jgi:hypothetical protein